MLLNFSSPIEAADGERRIISGQIVPFGSVGLTSAGRVIFERGSIQIPAVSKIKLLAQHNTNDPIGRAKSFSETATVSMAYSSFQQLLRLLITLLWHLKDLLTDFQ